MKRIITFFLCLIAPGLFAQSGSALNFDGTDDYITLSSDINQEFQSGKMTLEAWVYVETGNTNTSVNIVGESELGSGIIGGVLYVEGDYIKGGYFENGYGFTYVSANVDKDQWVHVALTINYYELRLYLNGVQVSSSVGIRSIPMGEDEWVIGKLWDGDAYLKGSIDEIRIWNTVRSCKEINSYKDIELTGNESGLVSYFNFNQGIAGGNNSSVTQLTDLTGSYNGTLYNFALDGATSNWIDGSANGVSGTTPVELPTISVSNRGIRLVDYGSGPNVYDSTFFGCTQDEVVRTFYIHNDGASVLNVTNVDIINGDPDFSINAPSVPLALNAGDSVAVTVVMAANPGAANRGATVKILSDDCDNADYRFSVSAGTGADPQVSLTVSQNPVCSGQEIELDANGAYPYIWPDWPGSSSTDQNFTIDQTTTYHVVGVSGNCQSLASVTVVVNQPVVTITPSANPICAGDALTLFVSGATTYTWQNSSITEGFAFLPEGTATYEVTGADEIGCTGTASIEVVVNDCTPTTVLSKESEYASMYPNPFANAFTIEVPGKTLEMVMYDSKGLLVKKQIITDVAQIELTGAASGLYKVMLYEDGKFVYGNNMMK